MANYERNDFGSRLKALFATIDKPISKIAIEMGYKSDGTLHQIISGRRKTPSIAVLYRLKEAFPEVDINELLFSADFLSKVNESNETYQTTVENTELKKAIVALNKELSDKNKQISRLNKELLEAKQEIIDLLKKG